MIAINIITIIIRTDIIIIYFNLFFFKSTNSSPKFKSKSPVSSIFYNFYKSIKT